MVKHMQNQYKSAYSDLYINRSDIGGKYNKAIGNKFEESIFELEQWVLSQIFADISCAEQKKYMDFACGTGRIIKYISEHVKFAEYFGLDLSVGMLEVAKSSINNTRVKFMARNIIHQPFDKKMDVITSFRLFLNLEKNNREILIKEINKMLADDGILVINNHMNRYSLKGLMAFLIHKILHKPLKSQAKPGEKSIINTSTHAEFKRLLEFGGLEIVKIYRISVIPGHKRLIPLPKKLFIETEKIFSRIPILNRLAKDQIFVCRKIKSLQK